MTASWRSALGTFSLLAGVLVATPASADEDLDGPFDPAATGPMALTLSDSPVVVPGQPRAVGNVAHRGASLAAPENTMAAIRQAIAHGADFVGIDVRRTRDNELVVLHDETLARTTDVETVFPDRAPWSVRDFTLAEIRRLDAGSWKSPIYTDERVPTLAEMLEALASSHTGAFLEIKQPELYGGLGGIGAAVVEALRQHTDWLAAGGPERRLVVQVFKVHEDFLREFAAAYPTVPIGLLGHVHDRLGDYTWGGQVNVRRAEVTADLVGEAHALGLAVSTYVVNDVPEMERVVDAGVDAISTDYPGLLRDVLRSRQLELDDDTAADTAPAGPVPVSWSLQTPSEVTSVDRRVPVVARMQTVDGLPARWAWVHVEHLTRAGWRPLQRPRVTGRNGELHTTVAARDGLRIRMRSVPSDRYQEAVSDLREVIVRPVETTGVLTGAPRVVDEQSAALRVHWLTEAGRPVTGSADLWARPAGGEWERRRTVSVVDGDQLLWVRPRVNTLYELRFSAGPWWESAVDRHYIDNVAPGVVVRAPVGAPRPSVRLPAQARAIGAGVNATVTRIPQPVWDQMTGRSWHRGCPVGRAGLRLVQLNYWAYDGYRRRGEVVVARAVTQPAVAALTELYDRGHPIRSMRRVSRLSGGLADSLAAGNTVGFSCAGPRRPGLLARGRALTVNPWENPEVTPSGVSPNRWWLPRSRPSPQVHASRRHPVVSAMASHGFRWAEAGRDYGRFYLR